MNTRVVRACKQENIEVDLATFWEQMFGWKYCFLQAKETQECVAAEDNRDWNIAFKMLYNVISLSTLCMHAVYYYYNHKNHISTGEGMQP